MDKAAGVDCKFVLQAAANSRARSAALKQRFQEGAVDEVSILGEWHLLSYYPARCLSCHVSFVLGVAMFRPVMLAARHGEAGLAHFEWYGKLSLVRLCSTL